MGITTTIDITHEHALLSLVHQNEGGGGWLIDRKGWDASSGVPICEWEGVTCGGDEDGPRTITDLNLANVGLTGTIPPELGLLEDLEHLTLSGNMLRGSIPQEIADLKKLVTLDLTGCFLTGTLPQSFGSSSLVSLQLANNAISGRFFREGDSPHLQSIQEIRMENNLLTGTLHGPTLSRMTGLVSLSLSDNDLSGLIPGEEIGSLSALRYLYLDTNSLVGPLPSQLATQEQGASILELWVQDNALSGTVPASYARFDWMHSFYIDGNKLTGEVPHDLCGPEINADFFANAPTEAERNYCDSIACPVGSVAFEGLYPCSLCPGGEAARLKNKYLGQTGSCSDYSERDVLRIFHEATTKGGSWSGMDDWGDKSKPVCEMTGITCDAQGRVTSISLRNRGLEGHIPDEIGSLIFLESMDVSDNRLMGYLPSDLRWTSITRLDVSGNSIRGLIPPLLCMMDDLNGNGRDGAFYCDRIACPPGTYNSMGYHAVGDGLECRPCYDETPFIGQKACGTTHKPFDWKDEFQSVKHASEDIGISAKVGLGIGISVLLIAVILYCMVRRNKNHWRKKYELWATNGCEAMIAPSRYCDEEKTYENNDGDKKGEVDDNNDKYLISHQSRYKDVGERDFAISKVDNADAADNHDERDPGVNNMTDYDDYDDDDDNMSRLTARSARSATELISHHQGISLKKSEKITRAVVARVPVGDIGRRAWDAASTINVRARRLSSTASLRRTFVDGGAAASPGKLWSNASGEADINDADLDITDSVSSRGGGMSTTMRRSKVYESSDLLDVPMVT
ncbi:hypothetical protein ACHAW5_006307 [Stephanodiscus triporus]|uniref:Leucine-rich repeat-containing N-terminal plant-type domain-containing protein n=1 Tax=Stephanodiscus triporus TaxID=2934178 RepID=A0ABD3NPQ0_9STRA